MRRLALPIMVRLPRPLLRAFAGCLALAALITPAAAQTLQVEGAVPVMLRAGPGATYPATGEIYPGERVERGPCDEVGRWCVVSTDRTWGWIDMSVVATPPRPAVPRAQIGRVPPPGARGIGPPGAATGRVPPGIARGLAPPPAVTVTPLPPQPSRGAALPSAIIAAIPPAPPVATPAPPVVPGARLPLLLSTSVPMRNVTDGYVNLRAGPGTDSAIVGRLAPGEGGPIDLCDAKERWCRITPEGQPQGWVLVQLVGLRRL